MLKEDVPVWYRFLERWGDQFLALYYDCLLGGPYYTPEQLKDPYQVMWRANVSKRADAITETVNQVWIIEVAKNPGLRAVGQLLVYESLWLEDPKITKPVKMILVCEGVDQDLIASATRRKILPYVMPAPPG